MDAYRASAHLFRVMADNVGHHAALSEPDLQLKQGNFDRIRRASALLFFTHPDDAVDNRLNMPASHAFSAMSQKKWLISAGLRAICHA